MSMRGVLEDRIQLWLDDPDSSVEYAEQLEGRWAVRMKQEVRDATTVWFTVGERSLEYEAYVIPVTDDLAEVFRQALFRNGRGWRCFFSLDGEGGLVLRGRLSAGQVTSEELDLVLGEMWEMVEVAFPSMLRAVIAGREKSG
jgi:hypothetical protein